VTAFVCVQASPEALCEDGIRVRTGLARGHVRAAEAELARHLFGKEEMASAILAGSSSRASSNGRTAVFQAADAGSIPAARSSFDSFATFSHLLLTPAPLEVQLSPFAFCRCPTVGRPFRIRAPSVRLRPSAPRRRFGAILWVWLNLVRAPAPEAGDWRFESSHPDRRARASVCPSINLYLDLDLYLDLSWVWLNLVRAPVRGTGDWGFESLHPDHRTSRFSRLAPLKG
jgi:hypothetical protein